MRVLVVDDSAAYRRVLEAAVRELGHDCAVAVDGKSAWETFSREGADVIISNWLMPGIDGDELCRMVRESERPYPYFVLFTARGGKRNVMRGMEAGADDYLGKPLDHDELEVCLVAAERVTGLHRRLAEQQHRLELLNRDLYEQSRQDVLTGVGNRLRMEEDLEAIEANTARNGGGYAIALCDVDHFKDFNDVRGHQAGDEVLRAVAAAIRGNCRQGDAVYRYGGEELLVLLPGHGRDGAAAAAERMRAAVAALGIDHPAGDPTPVVTISVGVSVRDEDGRDGFSSVVARADAALYEAKRHGRNRIEVDRSDR
jgi:two-component system, cell cycle response regulator